VVGHAEDAAPETAVVAEDSLGASDERAFAWHGSALTCHAAEIFWTKFFETVPCSAVETTHPLARSNLECQWGSPSIRSMRSHCARLGVRGDLDCASRNQPCFARSIRRSRSALSTRKRRHSWPSWRARRTRGSVPSPTRSVIVHRLTPK